MYKKYPVSISQVSLSNVYNDCQSVKFDGNNVMCTYYLWTYDIKNSSYKINVIYRKIY